MIFKIKKSVYKIPDGWGWELECFLSGFHQSVVRRNKLVLRTRQEARKELNNVIENFSGAIKLEIYKAS